MKKILINIFWFTLCTALFYFCGLYALSKLSFKGKPAVYITNDYYIWKGGGTYEKYRSPDSLLNKDVIIVGSSRAYRSYNPKQFYAKGLDAWNLGSSAQSIENSFRVIKEVIIPAKPKVILLDVSRLGFEQESIESSIDLITNTPYLNLKSEIIMESRDIRLYNTALTSIYNANLPALYSEEEYKGKGFSTKPDSLNEKWLNKLRFLTENSKNNMVIKDYKVLQDILEVCKTNAQKIVLVHSPISTFYSKIAQNDFIQNVSALSKEYEVPFYDFQYVDGIDTKFHFYDDSHLNAAGVEIFNFKLLKKVNFLEKSSFNNK